MKLNEKNFVLSGYLIISMHMTRPALYTQTFHRVYVIKFHRSRMLTRSKNEITGGRWWWWWYYISINSLSEKRQGISMKKIQFSFAHYTQYFCTQPHSNKFGCITSTWCHFIDFDLSLSFLQGTKHITWQLFMYDAQTNYIMVYNFSFISQQTSSCVLLEHENLILKIVYVNLLVFIMTEKRFCIFKTLVTLKILFFDT